MLGGGAGTLGISGVIGTFNQWPINQWVITYSIELVFLVILYTLPYALEFYKIYQVHKNDTPDEKEKERAHEEKMTKMYYDFQLNMKDKENEALKISSSSNLHNETSLIQSSNDPPNFTS